MRDITILGAGLSGLATSFHVGHEKCIIYESKPYYGGHIYSTRREGFTWDDGPHVLFNPGDYVKNLFAENVDGHFVEEKTRVSNFFRGYWIEHPAQSNLYQVPEPLRTECLNSFLATRKENPDPPPPANYKQWLDHAFGPVFAETFPAAYTRKYWTTQPVNLGIDWIGERVFYPKIEDVVNGAKGPLDRQTYWVHRWRYPLNGGYLSFCDRFARDAQIHYGKTIVKINFGKRLLGFEDGSNNQYRKLVSTIPLPVLIKNSEDAPQDVRDAASLLRCTRFIGVEIAVNHPSKRKESWIYVYDEDKLSTRISITENFSPNNAPPNCTGIAVEVYGSDYKQLPVDPQKVGEIVQNELIEMGLIENKKAVISMNVRLSPWGQVMYDHNRKSAIDRINSFLDQFGIIRVGRYSEWGYLMTHDCVLSSRDAAERINKEAKLN
jgi:protoporphyrinogen oxidase